jgi:tetratricopeptide (TPR) repeat protein
VDPDDAETAAALAEARIEPPKKAPPAPVAPPAPAAPSLPEVSDPVAAAMAETSQPAPRPSGAHPAPRTTGSAIPRVTGSHPIPRVTGSHPVQQRASGGHPAPRVTGSQPAVRASGAHPVARPSSAGIPKLSPSAVDPDAYGDDAPKKRKGQQKLFLAMVIAVPLVIAGYYGVGQWRAQKQHETSKYLDQAREALKHDSYAGYQEVCVAANKALEVTSDSAAAHGYLAYAYAIRWGEHGDGDEAHKQAEDHLKAARQAGEDDSHVYAADALLKTYSGHGAEALADLSKKVKALEAEGKQSSLMYLTLGLIQMNAGDLEHAADNLQLAQSRASGDPRIYAAFGSLYRRRGQNAQAWQNYDFALRFEHNHPESLLGKSILMLEQDAPAYDRAAGLRKKLLDADPAPTPRQLATAHLARALLIDRVSKELPNLKADAAKALAAATGVPQDASAARAEVQKEEDAGFTLDRNNPELHLIKAKRLAVDGQPDQAATEVRQAIKMDPTRAQFYIELAQDLTQKPGGEKEAAEALTTALRTMGDSPKLLVMLGNVYRRENKPEDALAAFTRAISDPKAKNPEARLALGQLYLARRDYPKAQEQLEKASQEFMGQTTKVAETYGVLGQVLEAKGERKKADEYYQKGLNADPDYASNYFFYARFLANGDRRDARKARSAAEEYLKRDPRGPYAAKAQRL